MHGASHDHLAAWKAPKRENDLPGVSEVGLPFLKERGNTFAMLGGLAETALLQSLRFQGLSEGQLDRVANEPSGGDQGVRNHVGQCGGKLDSLDHDP